MKTNHQESQNLYSTWECVNYYVLMPDRMYYNVLMPDLTGINKQAKNIVSDVLQKYTVLR